MKLSNQNRNHRRLELSMTSMIDVVFLLLIFFIVTTTFVRPEREIASAIKVQQKSASRQNTNLEPAIIEIIVDQESPLKISYRIGAVRTNELAQIETILSDFENKSEGAFVRVDPEAPYESAAQVIGLCRSAGFQTVSYLPLK